jgi:ankyrin repeat protein
LVLHIAVDKNKHNLNLQVVLALLAAGADIDAELDTAIGKKNQNHVFNVLVAAERENLRKNPNKKESTFLHQYAEKGDEKAVESLIKAGADVHARDKYGKTALNLAEQNGKKEIAAAIIANARHSRFGFQLLPPSNAAEEAANTQPRTQNAVVTRSTGC